MPDEVDFEPVDYDPFEAAARRTRQSVMPPGGRQEGAITHGLERIGEDFYNAAARPSRIWNELQTVPAGQPLSERPDIVDAAAQTAGDVMSIGYGGAPAGSAGIFGGKLAKTADLAALNRAEKMAAEGASREAIWNETGWFQGVDNKWRFEIPDYPSQVYTPKQGVTQPSEMFVEHKLAHPELYEAYPPTATNIIKPFERDDWRGTGNARGFYDEQNRTIGIAKGMPMSEGKSTLLHELQHDVQRHEGFPVGGSYYTPQVQAEADAILKSRQSAAEILQERLINEREAFIQQELKKRPGASQTDLAMEFFAKNPDKKKTWDAVFDELVYGTRSRRQYLNDAYRSLAGEVEARNVQARMNMPEDQRRATPPWQTEDIPREKQIVVHPSGTSDTSMEYESGVHPAWINTRLVTSKKAASSVEPQVVDLAAMRETPELYKQNVGLVKNYINMPRIGRASTDQAAEAFVDRAKDNLLWLHDQIPSGIRQRSMLWYDGGRNIVDGMVKQYGINDSTGAAVIAAMSPQKDWFQNVSLARRVLDITHGEQAAQPMSREMASFFKSTPSLNKPDYQPLFKSIRGKSLNDIDSMSLPADERQVLKAMWVRMYDQSHNPQSYHLITPEGRTGSVVTNKDGSPSRVQWGSLTEIGKAIGAIDAKGNPSALNAMMGEKHKVRNFYNNLLSPNSPRGDVTIDTHAVAAALLRPLAGADIEVAHNFANYAGKGLPNAAGSAITGIQGTYPLYAEAYRRAAAERGLLPRQMQSITWEGVRGLFPDTFKNAKNKAVIDNIWRQQRAGKLSLDEARKRVLKTAGGIDAPAWYERTSGGRIGAPHAPFQNPGHTTELPSAGVHGRAAKRRAIEGIAAKPSLEGFAKGGTVKLSHQTVHYIPKAKTDQHCAICSMFIDKNAGGPACTLVRNPIFPTGHCDRYEPTHG